MTYLAVVELVLRIAVSVVALGASASSLSAVIITALDTGGSFEAATNLEDQFNNVTETFQELQMGTYATGSIVSVIALLVVVMQIVMGVISTYKTVKALIILEVVLSAIFDLALIGGGIALIILAIDYSPQVNGINDLQGAISGIEEMAANVTNEFEQIRNSLATSAAFSLLGVINLGLMMVLLIKKWKDTKLVSV